MFECGLPLPTRPRSRSDLMCMHCVGVVTGRMASEFSPERIFISYSRSDGREAAEALERRLEEEDIRSWRDLRSMGSGDIRPQVLRAIEQAQHLVLILSRRALQSDWLQHEWMHARMVGRR